MYILVYKSSLCKTLLWVYFHAKAMLSSPLPFPNHSRSTELQNRVAYDCVQLHGGMGYMADYKIGRAYVDARPQPIYAGTNEIMMDLVSRTIFPK